MTARQQVYSCSVCGQMVAVVHQGSGRLVCCGKPMTHAGEEAAVASAGAPRMRTEPVAQLPVPENSPYWKCSNCKYVLQRPQPPETCPSCQQNCAFVDVTCYIPECGFSGPDNRLIGS